MATGNCANLEGMSGRRLSKWPWSFKHAAALGALAMLASCTQDLVVHASIQDAGVLLSFTEGRSRSSAPISPCVVMVAVYDVQSRESVWELNASNGSCQAARTIEIERVPPGFGERRRGQLRSGQRYYAVVLADTSSGRSQPWTQP